MKTLLTILASLFLFCGVFLGQTALKKTVSIAIAGDLNTLPYTLGTGDDRDRDGIPDDVDNCPDTPNGPDGGTCSEGGRDGEFCISDRDCGCIGYCSLDQEDIDDDGIGDTCETAPPATTTIPGSDDPDTITTTISVPDDTDNDGVPDFVDNCPDVPNFSQENSDSDYYGDACDNCFDYENEDQDDFDGDGLGDLCDNCPNEANLNQNDSDNDVVGDICDICPNDPDNDIDGDGVCGNEDGCPNDPDKIEPGICSCGVSDTDSDGDGTPDCNDFCPNDSYNDIDSDAVCGDVDNCPESFIDETVIIDGCDSRVENLLFGEGCTMRDLIAECESNAGNHGKFVSCVSDLTNDWKKDGLINGSEKGNIQSCAAKSDIP